MTKKIIIACIIMSIAVGVYAEKITFIPNYRGLNKYKIYQIITKVRSGTSFEFPAGYEIEAMILGDRQLWTADSDGRLGIVKPLTAGVETTLHITLVSGETFAFELVERATFNANEIYGRVLINPDQDEKLIQRSKRNLKQKQKKTATTTKTNSKYYLLENMNDKYKVTKRSLFKITKVMDDGTLTYIAMNNPQYKPIVFKSNKKGTEIEPVTYRENNSIYTIHHVLGPKERFILKIGKLTTVIKRGR